VDGIRVIRSARRKKTISARYDGDVLEVLAPKGMSDAELQPVIDQLRRRLERRKARRSVPSDADLAERAQTLNRRYFGGKLSWRSIRYVTNQNRRYGSCCHEDGTIRISDRLKRYPRWVLDYVLVHELAHLIHPDHSPAFWEVVNRYPLTERARGFLIAVGMFPEDANEPFAEPDAEDTD